MRLFPSSRFAHAKIGDCGEVVTGSTPSKAKPEFWGGDVPFVTPTQLGFREPVTTAEEFATCEGTKQGRILPEGAVLVCCIGSLGKTGVAGIPLITNQQINAIIFNGSKVNVHYGYYVARSIAPLLEQFAPSTTVKIVKKSTFANIEIPLPPLAEQKRIAAILDAADNLRVKRRQALAQLDNLTRSVFLDMFGDPVTNPMGWEVLQLAKIAELENGDRSSNYPSGEEVVDEGVLFLSTKNIVNFRLELAECKFITQEKFNSLSRGKLKRNDIVITLRGTLGSCAVFDCKFNTGFINAQLLIIRPFKVEPLFLQSLLSSKTFHDYFLRSATGVAVKQLTTQKIGSLSIPLPPLSLQRRFANLVESVEKQKARMRAHLTELDRLFASLQSRAFNGEL